jgi:hypothetical protein
MSEDTKKTISDLKGQHKRVEASSYTKYGEYLDKTIFTWKGSVQVFGIRKGGLEELLVGIALFFARLLEQFTSGSRGPYWIEANLLSPVRSMPYCRWHEGGLTV